MRTAYWHLDSELEKLLAPPSDQRKYELSVTKVWNNTKHAKTTLAKALQNVITHIVSICR